MANCEYKADELIWLPAWKIAALIEAGEISSEVITAACLSRIAEAEPNVHAFLTVSEEEALAAAREADKAVSTNQNLGPLHGVPIALKDEIWTAGIRSTAGSLIYENFIPDEDSTVVARLRAAGAVIIGKTQMPEFAMWPRSFNGVGEEARNPHDLTRISGASSGGSAASVAAGMVPLAIGSDGGGSTRIPASLCGVFGLHPTPGIIPDDGTFSYSPHSSLGPMTRDVRDAGLLLQVLADPNKSLVDYLSDFEAGVEGLRIAWTDKYGWINADSRVIDVAKKAAYSLVTAGAIVEEPTINIDDIWFTFSVFTRGYSIYEPGISVPYVQSSTNLEKCLAKRELLMPGVAELLTAPLPSADEYQKAKAQIEQVSNQLHSIFADFDVICSPTMPTVAPLIPDGWAMPYPDERMGTNYTSVVNVTHGSAVSYPCGDVEGLPVGLHIMAPSGQESLLLRISRVLESLRPWGLRPEL